jgi:SEC-C motif domain protein
VTCPCGTGRPLDACCGRYLRGDADAPTAEALMRSRYTAYVVGDDAYVVRTWHPTTRPLDAGTEVVAWLGMDVLDVERGGLLDAEGEVEFVARYRGGSLHERSRFVRVDGRWSYLDGTVRP